MYQTFPGIIIVHTSSPTARPPKGGCTMHVWHYCYWGSCYVAPILRFLLMCAVLLKKAGTGPGNETSTITLPPSYAITFLGGKMLALFVCGLLMTKSKCCCVKHRSLDTNRRVFPLFCELLEWKFLVDEQYKYVNGCQIPFVVILQIPQTMHWNQFQIHFWQKHEDPNNALKLFLLIFRWWWKLIIVSCWFSVCCVCWWSVWCNVMVFALSSGYLFFDWRMSTEFCIIYCGWGNCTCV